MNTGDPENKKLSHLDEYKALREEITMCQHEMHRTWLWASIAAGAVYTWLPSHRSDINSIHLHVLVWYIPPFLLIFCFFRYGVFWFRIRSLADYQDRIEQLAFREEKGSSTFSVDELELSRTQLPGFAHYNGECLDKKIVKRLPSWRGFFTGVKVILWSALIVCCLLLSWSLPQTIRECLDKKIGKWLPSWRHFFTGVAVFLWSALIVCSILLSWSLSQTKSDNAISGQVTASLTGLPIVGATVAVTDSSKITLTFTTDAAGHYGVSNLPTGPATVTAKKTGYTRAHSSPTIVPGTNTQNEVLVLKSVFENSIY